MSEAEQNAKIKQFIGFTDTDTERAKFYLESAAWNMDIAVMSYFDGVAEESANEIAGQAIESPAVGSNRDVPVASASNHNPAAKPKKWQPQSNSYPRIMTFGALKNAEADDKDSDDEEGQRFYAGGSITSGQQVIGPPRNNTDIITDMFQTAQKYAINSAPSTSGSSAQESGPSHFFGTGYMLGQTADDTEVIPSPNSTSKRPSNQEVVLKVWKEGFTINDGELHSIDQQENRDFLHTVIRGEDIPPLLLKEVNVSSNDELNVSVEDHRFEEYVPTKPKKKIFGGSGNVLGSPAPEVVGDEGSKEASSDDGVVNEAAARAEVPLTPDAPTTSLQIRLVDGTRIVATFNQSHTIGDIRRYIIAARPYFTSRPFKLQSSYPPKTLDNNDQTLSEAGLLNTVIFQRIG